MSDTKRAIFRRNPERPLAKSVRQEFEGYEGLDVTFVTFDDDENLKGWLAEVASTGDRFYAFEDELDVIDNESQISD